MATQNGENIDVEPNEHYVQLVEHGRLGLEPIDVYVRRVKAEIRLSKARAANTVAYILVGGVVLSLPLFLVAALWVNKDSAEVVANVFEKWYDVVAPLVLRRPGASAAFPSIRSCMTCSINCPERQAACSVLIPQRNTLKAPGRSTSGVC